MIPLMMEPSYSPDGWLGIILGSKLWMDFRKDPSVGIQQLIKEISKARVGMDPACIILFCVSVVFFCVLICNLLITVCTCTLCLTCFHSAASQAQSLGNAPPKAATNEKILQWKKEDVAKWLQDIGFAV